MNKEETCTAVGFLIFVIGTALSLVYVNSTLWHHVIANAAKPQNIEAGWRIREGTVTSVGEPWFGSSPPQRDAVVEFVDYYGARRKVSLHFGQYRLQAGAHEEVDVSKDGSIYVPASIEAYNGDWNGPRAASDALPVALSLLSAIVFAVLGCLVYQVLNRIEYPTVRSRLGTR